MITRADAELMFGSLYTLVVYMGSSIYTPSAPAVEEKFGVSATAASLGLALYVLGCEV
jgi:DHA1 family multidrug resistance protein-like MFS transporter